MSKGPPRDLRPSLREGQSPIAELPTLAAGTHLVVLESTAIAIELAAPKFEEYLAEEHLDEVRRARTERKQGDAPGRERYTRYLKALVQVGAASDGTATRAVGGELEIVPTQDPFAGGTTLAVQVLFRGKPLAGRFLVAAHRVAGKVTTETARTDGEGKARFTMERRGDWMVRLVQMEPSREPGADWRSYWSSLTFSLGK